MSQRAGRHHPNPAQLGRQAYGHTHYGYETHDREPALTKLAESKALDPTTGGRGNTTVTKGAGGSQRVATLSVQRHHDASQDNGR
jgi:hypothetical protein